MSNEESSTPTGNTKGQTEGLESASFRTLLAKRISDAIDTHSVAIYDEGFRWHLGASKIGEDCTRKLWYSFRWVGTKEFHGRLYRLWNRGHLEETRHINWLRGIGFQVWDIDENTGKQFKIQRSVSGHFGGSLDAILRFPSSWGISEPALLSCKTSGTGAGFNKVKNDPLAISKPQHYIQESVYGYNYSIAHVVYICANKNDDDLAIKVEKLDFELAKRMELKAEKIVFSPKAPPRISENPNSHECKNLCEFIEICHYKKPAVRNCRSCISCRPIDGGEFFCDTHNNQIPRDFILQACDSYKSITVSE